MATCTTGLTERRVLELEHTGARLLGGPIDVSEVDTVTARYEPAGAATAEAAVFEIKKGYGPATPDVALVSYGTPKTVTITADGNGQAEGGTETAIDVSDAAALDVVCTTAKPGARLIFEFTGKN